MFNKIIYPVLSIIFNIFCYRHYELPKQDKLIDAIFQEDIELVLALLDEYGDLNQTLGDSGSTPLMIATECKNISIMKILIEHGADINSQGFYDYAPLHYAVHQSIDSVIQTGGEQGDEEIDVIEFLLINGADMHLGSQDGSSLEIAKNYGSRKVIKFLESWDSSFVLT